MKKEGAGKSGDKKYRTIEMSPGEGNELKPETKNKMKAVEKGFNGFKMSETSDEYIFARNGRAHHFAKMEKFPIRGENDDISWLDLNLAIAVQLNKILKEETEEGENKGL